MVARDSTDEPHRRARRYVRSGARFRARVQRHAVSQGSAHRDVRARIQERMRAESVFVSRVLRETTPQS